jgi:hypothetical protein
MMNERIPAERPTRRLMNGSENSEERFQRTDRFIAVLDRFIAAIDEEDYRAHVRSIQEELDELIRQGVDVDARNVYGVPVLLLVIRAWESGLGKENSGVVEYCVALTSQLIDNGADLNIQDADGNTALIMATRPKYRGMDTVTYPLVKLLVEAGACLDRSTEQDQRWPMTPLFAAAWERREQVVQLLLASGANVNARVGRNTPLYAALRAAGDVYPKPLSGMVSALLEYGANPGIEPGRIFNTAISHSPASMASLLDAVYGDPQPHHHPRNDQSPEKAYETFIGKLDELIVLNKRPTDPAPLVEVLCSACQAFKDHAVKRTWFDHSTGAEALHESLLNGCTLCQLIQDCVPGSFGRVQLYYYSALSPFDSVSRDYYERILARGEIDGPGKDFVYGELSLAVIDGT